MHYAAHRHRAPDSALTGYLDEARQIIAGPRRTGDAGATLAVGPDFEKLRWFWLPEEIERELAAHPAESARPASPGLRG
jgi:hypothetical protein